MHKQRGFTIIEIMVTLALLATLAAAAIPLAQHYQQRRNEETLRESLREIRNAIDRYVQAGRDGKIEKTSNASLYPPTLKILEEGVVDKTSPNKVKIYFLRRIPRDPFCECEGRPNVETWRVRASTEPPGEFNGGKDVFDVTSTSSAIGLNGVPYEEW